MSQVHNLMSSMVPAGSSVTDWLTAIGTILAAFATTGAVIVSLYQAQKAAKTAEIARDEAEEAHREAQRPKLKMDWLEYHSVNQPDQQRKINSFEITISNFGGGSALDVQVEFEGLGLTNGVLENAEFGLGIGPVAIFTERPVMHILPMQTIKLAIQPINSFMPSSVTIRLLYSTIFGERKIHEWLTVTIPNESIGRIPI